MEDAGDGGSTGWPQPPCADSRGFSALRRKLNLVSLSNTARESALVYPQDLWFSPGTHHDGYNSAMLLVQAGGPVGSSAPWLDRPPRAAPSPSGSPCTPHATEQDVLGQEPGVSEGDSEDPEQGTGPGRGYAGLKGKVSQFGSGLRH